MTKEDISSKISKEGIPAVKGLFTWPTDKPQLIASRCRNCGTYHFPKISTCSNPFCDDKENVEEVLLSTRGKLWSYTIHYFNPPPPAYMRAPYAIGLVELPEGIKVLGMLTTIENLKVGMEVELVVDELYVDEKGNKYLTWKFKPITE